MQLLRLAGHRCFDLLRWFVDRLGPAVRVRARLELRPIQVSLEIRRLVLHTLLFLCEGTTCGDGRFIHEALRRLWGETNWCPLFRAEWHHLARIETDLWLTAGHRSTIILLADRLGHVLTQLPLALLLWERREKEHMLFSNCDCVCEWLQFEYGWWDGIYLHCDWWDCWWWWW